MLTNTRPLYIFDIDGTLCNIEQRLHFLEDKTDKDRWDKFYEACINDLPNIPVIKVMNAIGDSGAEIWLFSGRSSKVRVQTLHWLDAHTKFSSRFLNYFQEMLTMRPIGDFTKDHLLKQSWLNSMLDVDRNRLVAVFDDRQRVVDMWRANGVPCFQVAKGDF